MLAAAVGVQAAAVGTGCKRWNGGCVTVVPVTDDAVAADS